MKSFRIFFVFFVLFSFVACKEKPAATVASIVPVVHSEMDSEVKKTVAKLTISGMHCSDGCGGKIQKELQALNGVVNTKLDFEEERATNIVSVEYIPADLNEQDMIECVNSIMDGAYPVSQVEVITYKGLQSK